MGDRNGSSSGTSAPLHQYDAPARPDVGRPRSRRAGPTVDRGRISGAPVRGTRHRHRGQQRCRSSPGGAAANRSQADGGRPRVDRCPAWPLGRTPGPTPSRRGRGVGHRRCSPAGPRRWGAVPGGTTPSCRARSPSGSGETPSRRRACRRSAGRVRGARSTAVPAGRACPRPRSLTETSTVPSDRSTETSKPPAAWISALVASSETIRDTESWTSSGASTIIPATKVLAAPTDSSAAMNRSVVTVMATGRSAPGDRSPPGPGGRWVAR